MQNPLHTFYKSFLFYTTLVGFDCTTMARYGKRPNKFINEESHPRGIFLNPK